MVLFIEMINFWHVICLSAINTTIMTDIDFIRLAALAFTFQLIGKSADPVSDGVQMAERLFDKLNKSTLLR